MGRAKAPLSFRRRSEAPTAPPMRIRFRSKGFALSVAGLLVACSFACSDANDSPAPSLAIEFPVLRTLESASEHAEGTRLVRQIPAGPDCGWTSRGCDQALIELKTGKRKEKTVQPAVQLSDLDFKSELWVPGPFEGGSFNLIVLQYRAGPKWKISAELQVGGERLPATSMQAVSPGGQAKTLAIEIPRAQFVDGEIEGVHLLINGLSKPLTITSIDLLQQSALRFLPEPDLGPASVLVGEEMRSALGINPTRGLAGQADAVKGSTLLFALGIPGALAKRGPETRVDLELEGESGQQERLSFEVEADTRSGEWAEFEVDLGAFADQRVSFEWRVAARKDGFEPILALADVRVTRPGPRKANVLFVTSDTHRGDHMGLANEGVEIRTPALDALADRGIFFDDCFSSTNVTNPSHVAMMTGAHPRDTGIISNYAQLAAGAPTLAEAFRAAGYYTVASISVAHLGDAISGLGQGFQRFSDPMDSFHRDGQETIEVLEGWLEDSKGVPTFVWLHLFDAHTPYEFDALDPTSYYGKSEKAAFDSSLPELEGIELETAKKVRLKGVRDLDLVRAYYKSEIDRLDSRLASVFDHPAFQDAIIAFTGDHGESLGNHDLYFNHGDLYRDTLHVPLVLAWPNSPAGLRYPSPVSNLDLGRTLLDLSGNLDAEFPGQNLALLLDAEEATSPARFGLSAHRFEATINHEGWHLQIRLRTTDDDSNSGRAHLHRVELFYLPDDPNTQNDLVDVEQERARRMRQELLDWLADYRDLGWVGSQLQDPKALKELEKLGYTGESAAPIKGVEIAPDCDCSWCPRFR